MGTRIVVGDGGKKDKPSTSSSKVEIRVGKKLNPNSSVSKPSSTSDKTKEKCSKCKGPFRSPDGTYGSKRIEAGKTTLTCKSCQKKARSK
jgi:hypothetical protein